MSQRAGWYDDPENSQNLRYYDGVVWTSHTTPRAAPSTPPTTQLPQQPQPGSASQYGQQPPQYGQQPQQYGQQPQQYGQQPQQYGQQPPQYGQPPSYQGQQYGPPAYGPPGAYGSMPPAYSGALGGPTTPDGAPLASYGQRVGAYILDYLIVGVLTLLASSYWLYQFIQWYSTYLTDVFRQAEQGGQPTIDQTALQTQIMTHLWPVLIVSLLVRVIYDTFFLTRTGATPGKMALGITVRLRERPGSLSVVDALKRQVIQIAAGLIGFVAFLSYVGSLAVLLDLLWPLWDDKRQALHDKIAQTNVVVKRRER